MFGESLVRVSKMMANKKRNDVTNRSIIFSSLSKGVFNRSTMRIKKMYVLNIMIVSLKQEVRSMSRLTSGFDGSISGSENK
jgi:hypothetical protein